MKRRFMYLLLWALGFASACDKEKEGAGFVCMYGTPQIDASVKGHVTDPEGNPIAGIEISQSDGRTAPATTDANGMYDFEQTVFPYSVELVFTDIDGPANGGEFETKQVTVEFTEADRTGERRGDWHYGSFARKDIDITLETKNAE